MTHSVTAATHFSSWGQRLSLQPLYFEGNSAISLQNVTVVKEPEIQGLLCCHSVFRLKPAVLLGPAGGWGVRGKGIRPGSAWDTTPDLCASV